MAVTPGARRPGQNLFHMPNRKRNTCTRNEFDDAARGGARRRRGFYRATSPRTITVT